MQILAEGGFYTGEKEPPQVCCMVRPREPVGIFYCRFQNWFRHSGERARYKFAKRVAAGWFGTVGGSAIAEDHLLSRAGQVGGVLQGEDGRAQGEVQGRGGRGRRLDEGAAKTAAARM